MSNLTTRQDALTSRVEVSVLSKADPLPGLLRVARVIAQREPSVRNVFSTARTEGWSSERLAVALLEAFTPFFMDGAGSEDPDNVKAVATYLADEYMQIGDSILLISSETGRALAKLRDEDFYQPVPVPREGGGMVERNKAVRPEVEAFIVQWTFDRAYEQETERALLAKLPRTQLLREAGDRRVLFSTRKGRHVLAETIRDTLPSILPEHCKGSTRALFKYIQLTKEAPTDPRFTCLGQVESRATATYPLQDRKAKNLRHDVLTAILSTTASGWARGIASHILLCSKDIPAQGAAVSFLQVETQIGLWVCSPNAAMALATSNPAVDVLPVGLSDNFVLGFTEPAGYLRIDEESYKIQSREVFDRWEVVTAFTATVWVDWSKARSYELEDVPMTGIAVEIV